MQIRFINHASYAIEDGTSSLVFDPWLEGRVFNHGWALLSNTVFRYDDFQNVTHILFSHEHPDHFSPPNVTKIPPKAREKITILYHYTDDKKVIKFCQGLGFRDVVELRPDQWYHVSDTFSVRCEPYSTTDSWICVTVGDFRILNINDCVFNTHEAAEDVKRKIGRIDLLSTQFSYGQWEGPKENPLARRAAAYRKLEELDLKVRAFQPRYILPFASFVWFCHPENYYFNDSMHRIEDIFRFLQSYEELETVVLYPGDVWSPGEEHDPQAALARYAADYERILRKPELSQTNAIDIPQIEDVAARCRQKLLDLYSPEAALVLGPLRVFLDDHGQAIQFSLRSGFELLGSDPALCDIAISSDSLYNCFSSAWGFNTLHVNGRFRILRPGGFQSFLSYAAFTNGLNHGLVSRRARLNVVRYVLALRNSRLSVPVETALKMGKTLKMDKVLWRFLS